MQRTSCPPPFSPTAYSCPPSPPLPPLPQLAGLPPLAAGLPHSTLATSGWRGRGRGRGGHLRQLRPTLGPHAALRPVNLLPPLQQRHAVSAHLRPCRPLPPQPGPRAGADPLGMCQDLRPLVTQRAGPAAERGAHTQAQGLPQHTLCTPGSTSAGVESTGGKGGLVICYAFFFLPPGHAPWALHLPAWYHTLSYPPLPSPTSTLCALLSRLPPFPAAPPPPFVPQSVGRRRLALKLLEEESSCALQVPLLLSLSLGRGGSTRPGTGGDKSRDRDRQGGTGEEGLG